MCCARVRLDFCLSCAGCLWIAVIRSARAHAARMQPLLFLACLAEATPFVPRSEHYPAAALALNAVTHTPACSDVAPSSDFPTPSPTRSYPPSSPIRAGWPVPLAVLQAHRGERVARHATATSSDLPIVWMLVAWQEQRIVGHEVHCGPVKFELVPFIANGGNQRADRDYTPGANALGLPPGDVTIVAIKWPEYAAAALSLVPWEEKSREELLEACAEWLARAADGIMRGCMPPGCETETVGACTEILSFAPTAELPTQPTDPLASAHPQPEAADGANLFDCAAQGGDPLASAQPEAEAAEAGDDSAAEGQDPLVTAHPEAGAADEDEGGEVAQAADGAEEGTAARTTCW